MAENGNPLELSDQQLLHSKFSLSKADEESNKLIPNIACNNNSTTIYDGKFDSSQLAAHVMDDDEVVATELDNSVSNFN